MENNAKLKTLKDWAFSCMPSKKAKSFLEYYDGRIYKIVKGKPYLLKDDDLISESFFNAYFNDFEDWVQVHGV